MSVNILPTSAHPGGHCPAVVMLHTEFETAPICRACGDYMIVAITV